MADRKITRRSFLKAGLGAGLAGTFVGGAEPLFAAPQSEPARASKSRVVIVRDHEAVDDHEHINQVRLRSMLTRSMTELTSSKDLRHAWREFVKPTDVVGLKLNCNGGPSMSTSLELVRLVTDDLTKAGVPANNIIIWERNNWELEQCGFKINTDKQGMRCFGTIPSPGYDREVDFGSGRTQLSRILTQQCSVVIHLGKLKTASGFGITGAVKYIYGIVNNPWALHGGGGDPYAAQVLSYPAVKKKTKLHIIDALTVLYNRGPHDDARYHNSFGALLASTDPVAIDYQGIRILEAIRGRKLVPYPRHVEAAGQAKYGLGTFDPKNMDVINIDLARS